MAISKIPPRTAEQVRRLRAALLALPEVAGRLELDPVGTVEANYSGAAFLAGTWREHRAAEPRPALVKLGANPREVRWAALLARQAEDLVPALYAGGDRLGGEALSWIVMERCPIVLDYAWGDRLYETVLDAGARFQVASRRLAGPVGPADVGAEQLATFMRARAAGSVFPAAATAALFERFEEDWAWALSASRVELCHGDLHPANAVWRVAPPDAAARALLIDHAPRALPWAYEPAYCQVLYWPAGCRADGPGLVHRMASRRRSYGLEVPEPAALDRMAALFLVWHALRFWPHLTARQPDPRWAADIRSWVEAAAALPPAG